MADRQFTYRVDIDTASAKAAADATRAMFAQSISRTGGGGGRGGGGGGGGGGSGGDGGSRVGGTGAGLREIGKFRAAEAKEAKKAADSIARDAKKAADIEVAEQQRVLRAHVTFRRSEVREAVKAVNAQVREDKRAADVAIKESQRALNASVMFRRTQIREANKAHNIEIRNMRTEANEMNRVFNQRRRQQELQQRQGAMGLMRGIMTGDVGAILGGGVVGFAAMQAGRMLQNTIRTIGEMGTEGAGIARITRSFDELAESIGLNADLLAGKMRNAVQGTVSDYELMSHANLLLVTAQQGGVKVTEEQIASLARFARLRSTQLTLEGKNLTASEAFSRLIRGISKRESELLDELGISSKQLAAVTGKSLQEISGSVQDMMDAVLQVAEADFAKFGDPLIDAAGRIEQANARVINSMNELRQELAEPVADVKVNLAGFVEGFSDAAVAVLQWNEAVEIATSLQRKVEKIQLVGARGTDNIAINATVAAIEELDIARARGEIGFIGYWKAIGDVIQRFDELQSSLYGVLPGMQEMNQTIAVLLGMTGGGVGLTRADFPGTPGATVAALRQDAAAENRIQAVIAGKIAPGDLTEEEAKFRLAIGNSREQIEIFTASLADLTTGSEEDYAARANILKLQESIAAEEKKQREGIKGIVEDFHQAQLGIQLASAELPQQIDILKEYNATLVAGSLEELANQEKIASLQMRLNDENAREWKRAAKETEANFKAAAKEAASAWESAISGIPGIPGLSGASPVTDTQMQMAAAGLPVNFADNFTRRMNDELVNGVDWPEVSRGLVEQIVSSTRGLSMGMLGGVPSELLAQMATEDISSGAVFGTDFGKSLAGLLINTEGLKESARTQGLVTIGKEFVKGYVQEVLSAEGFDFANVTNPLSDAIINGFSAEGGKDIAGPTIAGLTNQFGQQKAIAGITNLGKTVAENLFTGFGVNIAAQGWAAAIITAIKNDIAASLAEMAVAN